MAKKLKKAFTITELVIVIAVVAILAAVLIPTFVNIVDKANESTDTQAVREMNLALENAEILEGQPETLTDALEVLANAGMDANAYKALSKGRKFVWDSSINRVLYVTDNNKVLYPQEYKDTIYTFGTWITLTGQMAGDESWKENGESVSTYTLPEDIGTVTGGFTKYSISSNAQLISLSESLRAGEFANKGAGLIVELEKDAEIDLLGAEWVSISEFAGIFNGNGATISNLTMTDRTQDCETEFSSTNNNTYQPYGFISVYEGRYFGNVTFENVNIDCPGEAKNPTLSTNHTVAVAIGAVRNMDTSNTTYIDRITVESGSVSSYYRVAGIVGFAGGIANGAEMTGDIVISNCVNKATITSTLCASTYNTAAGILSTSNQLKAGAELIIENNKNYGTINGQLAGGIAGPLFGGGAHESKTVDKVTTYYYDYTVGSAGTVIIRNNENHGAVNARHYSGYSDESYNEDGLYIAYNQDGTRAAGIVTAQTHQDNTYVYGNVNTGEITAVNEDGVEWDTAKYEIAFVCEKQLNAGLGYIVGFDEKGNSAPNYLNADKKEVATDLTTDNTWDASETAQTKPKS